MYEHISEATWLPDDEFKPRVAGIGLQMRTLSART